MSRYLSTEEFEENLLDSRTPIDTYMEGLDVDTSILDEPTPVYKPIEFNLAKIFGVSTAINEGVTAPISNPTPTKVDSVFSSLPTDYKKQTLTSFTDPKTPAQATNNSSFMDNLVKLLAVGGATAGALAPLFTKKDEKPKTTLTPYVPPVQTNWVTIAAIGGLGIAGLVVAGMAFRKKPTPIKKNPALPVIGAAAIIGAGAYLANKYLRKKEQPLTPPKRTGKKVPRKTKKAPRKVIKRRPSGGAPAPGTYKFD
jgi:hypothetical protein